MTKTTADQTYKDRKKEVEVMLVKIGIALKKHAKGQAKKSKDWGYVGDLNNILWKLTDVNKFLRNEQKKLMSKREGE